MQSRAETRIDIIEILNFSFPAHLKHPRSYGRLIIYGLYGPLVDGKLRAGPRRNHKVEDWEIECMCKAIDMEDTLRSYVPQNRPICSIPIYEQRQILSQSTLKLPRLNRHDLFKIFDRVPSDSEGTMSFYDVQNAIYDYRVRRNRQKKANDSPRVSPFFSNASSLSNREGESSLSSKKHISQLKFFSSRKLKLSQMGPSQASVRINRLLNSKSFKISTFRTKNSKDLPANVILLREDN
mmetsp:Transcript_7789/g.11758  ORF Transcript_7789/g.11758 Transcript_7789/m.11758 type:complete len:238 (+) Transcript_7789:260-973(+)